MARWNRWDFFPKSVRREAKGGIKAASQRGAFGTSWWAKRWIAVLEGFDIGARLGRGRSYARSGQVLSISVEKGLVTAKVQGSRPSPYRVEIKVKGLTSADWKKFVQAVSSQAIYAAKLLAGEMPQDIEAAFREQRLSLFPATLREIETDCSCPDWSNPCKHIAAVYYLLGEEFDRDPFLIFRVRGMGRDEMAAMLGDLRKPEEAAPALPPEPLAVEGFWPAEPRAAAAALNATVPAMDAAIVKRLGRLPFWSGDRELADALAPVYRAASERAAMWLAGSQAKAAGE